MIFRDADSSVYPGEPTVPVSKAANPYDSPRRDKRQSEEKSKGEEKALARRSLLAEAAPARGSSRAKAANRYTWKLKFG
jgi:hypothetical protein